jgi:NAD(P)-dependent dehydrogenase (short-subunit alcohol dehydrogenase family)
MGMLEGKVAVVTDADRGIGRAIALLTAEEGARVVAHDGEGVVREIRERGGEAVACAASVRSWQGCHDLMQTALEQFGRLDILFNSVAPATSFTGKMICDVGKEEWASAIRNSLKASFLCTRAASPHMRKQRHGRLIHFVPPEALIGGVGCSHHGAAQAAIAGLSRNAAIEMERYGVTSNCIVPCAGTGGGTNAEDPAPLAVFLGSDAAQGLSGQIFGVRGSEIFLFSQSRIQRSIHDSEGWTVKSLSRILGRTMGPHFTPLETSDSYFSWESRG